LAPLIRKIYNKNFMGSITTEYSLVRGRRNMFVVGIPCRWLAHRTQNKVLPLAATLAAKLYEFVETSASRGLQLRGWESLVYS
jgi:hypothetical protein